jgi:hypothetical protein
MPPEVHDPIQDGIRQNITGRRDNGHSTTAEELFADYPADAIPVAGKTGHRPGPRQLPVERLSAFTAYSIDPARPFTVTSYLEKAGVRLGGRGSGREVHVRGVVGRAPTRPGSSCRSRSTPPRDKAGQGPAEGRRTACMASTNANTITPAWRPAPRTDRPDGSSRCCSASRTLVSATSAPAPPTPSRNIDWVLLLGPARPHRRRLLHRLLGDRGPAPSIPYTFVTRQVIFAIVAAVVMVIVMLFDYEWWKQRARTLYVPDRHRPVRDGRLQPRVGDDDAGRRRRPDPDPAGRVRQVRRAAGACALPQRGAQRREGVSYPRSSVADHRRLPAVLIIVQPDLGTGSVLIAMTMGVLLVAGAKARYIATISLLSVATVGAAYFARLVNDYQLARIRVFFDEDNPACRRTSTRSTTR